MDGRVVLENPPGREAAVASGESPLSEQDIRHNVRVNVLVAAVFQIGAADMALAAGPLLVYLSASNTVIGLINGLGWMALLGVFLSPYISRRCPRKKWYMFWAQVPYIGAWGLIGLAVICSGLLGLTLPQLLTVIVVLSIANAFFSGFVTLPSQEFLAACIPMSHRGRYTGFSMSVGAVGSLISCAIGGVILATMAKPMSFGWLYVLFWIFAQGGCALALLAREPQLAAPECPTPWSRGMFKALKSDVRFLRVLAANLAYFAVLFPCTIFVPIYGYKVLGLPAAAAAAIAIVQQAARLVLSSHIGIWTDRIGAKRMAPLWFILTGLSVTPLFFSLHPLALYATVALQAVCFAGIMAAFNPLLLGTPAPENRSGHYSVQIILRNFLDACGMMATGFLIDRVTFSSYFAAWAAVAVVLAFGVRWLLQPLGDRSADYS